MKPVLAFLAILMLAACGGGGGDPIASLPPEIEFTPDPPPLPEEAAESTVPSDDAPIVGSTTVVVVPDPVLPPETPPNTIVVPPPPPPSDPPADDISAPPLVPPPTPEPEFTYEQDFGPWVDTLIVPYGLETVTVNYETTIRTRIRNDNGGILLHPSCGTTLPLYSPGCLHDGEVEWEYITTTMPGYSGGFYHDHGGLLDLTFSGVVAGYVRSTYERLTDSFEMTFDFEEGTEADRQYQIEMTFGDNLPLETMNGWALDRTDTLYGSGGCDEQGTNCTSRFSGNFFLDRTPGGTADGLIIGGNLEAPDFSGIWAGQGQ